MKKHSTKRALVASVLALAMCFAMLAGTTFAWFTDSVSSSSNIIKSGKLEVGLEKYDEKASAWVDTANKPIFNYEKWEPGYTQVVNLKIVNNGTLAFKWQAGFVTEKTLSKLADVINVYVRSGKTEDAVKVLTNEAIDFDAKAEAGEFAKYTLRQFINNAAVINNGEVKADIEVEGEIKTDSDYLTIVLQMDKNAGNDYMNLDLGGKFDLKIFATQLASESDSFGSDYDKAATFYGSVVDTTPAEDDKSAKDYYIYNDKNEKVGYVTAPAGAFAEGADTTEVKITDTDYLPNITVETGREVVTFNISVTNLKEGNTEPLKTGLFIGKGLDPTTVKAYHYSDEIAAVYNPYDGYVTFETADFSPFTLVYDAKSVYIPTVVDPNHPDAPQAIITGKSEFVNVELPWGSYGQWSPTEGLDSQLEAAFEFKCQDTLEKAKKSPYANWFCDFYVKLDRDLAANQIFLGGNYGSFGWIGFHNGELALAANTEIPLLGSVAGSWTYVQVVNNVGTFLCGVGDVDDALVGATFTVMLRLTNPENENDFVNVATIEHKFGKSVTDESGLKDALEKNDGKIDLSKGEYNMSQIGSLNGKEVTISGNKDTVMDATMISVNDQFVTGASLVFEGVTINFSTENYYGLANTDSLVFRNCTINGYQYLYGKNVVFENCTFNSTGYAVCVYAAENVTFKNCTFNTAGKAILLYKDDLVSDVYNVTVENCTFNATASATASAITNQPCAAIEINNFGASYNLTTSGNIIDPDFSGLWRIKIFEASKGTTVTVNGTAYTQTALDGKLMTVTNKEATVIG